ncbi:lipase member H-like [Musca autumnalis]|uniref:lipase member H-like n=1 Tax=Musca autumnalis TaxID=221902 RepID=UPI003CF1596E
MLHVVYWDFVELLANDPTMETVYLQYRSPCETIEYPLQEARKLLTFSEFSNGRSTVVYVPGWSVESPSEMLYSVAKAFHCRGDYNLLIFNPDKFLLKTYYISAYHKTMLGEYLAVALRNMYIDPNRLHLIGHSLGAHIVGFAGRHYRHLTNCTIERITGLDPARPCFAVNSIFPRISVGDAGFVDIIHFDPDNFGIKEPIGDVDFYPFGMDAIFVCVHQPANCRHLLSFDYFLETVHNQNTTKFVSYVCRSLLDMENHDCWSKSEALMGFEASTKYKGIFYVDINGPSNSPNSNKCGECSK